MRLMEDEMDHMCIADETSASIETVKIILQVWVISGIFCLLWPSRIREVVEDSTLYRLDELDGTQLSAAFAGNRLKKFFLREELIRVRPYCGLGREDCENINDVAKWSEIEWT